ncbi:unnamed protein product [Schistosoma turkestanicum]|nr:unnamed protein product [Schistosoma turkestanicum]
MGGSASAPIPGGGTSDYHVLRVQDGSPGHQAGLEAFFDFIVAIGDKRLEEDNDCIKDLLQASKDKPVRLLVYSTKSQSCREVTLIPNNHWGGQGLMGVSIRYCSFERANENVWHVLSVEPKSPADLAGLKPYTDYIIGANSVLNNERAIKWKSGNSMDGLTTNGVMMLRIPPAKIIERTNQASDRDLDIRSKWREVSVCGSVYEMRSNRCVPTNLVNEDNILTDMTIIDLCGVTLLWRSRSGLKYTACSEDLMKMINGLNQAHIQCPVLYRTLKLPFLPQSTPFSPHSDLINRDNNNELLNNDNVLSKLESDQISPDQMPYVYVSCGHVHGWHNWRAAGDVNSRRTCPLCLQASLFIPLRMGIESAFYVDRSLATHCFNPCGHIASENTVRYWCSLQLLNRHNFELHARCPFCLTSIHSKPVKLLFQSDLSEEEFLELIKEQLYVRTLNMEKHETLSRSSKLNNNQSSKINSSSSSHPIHPNHDNNNNNSNQESSHLSTAAAASSSSPPRPLTSSSHNPTDRLLSSSCSSCDDYVYVNVTGDNEVLSPPPPPPPTTTTTTSSPSSSNVLNHPCQSIVVVLSDHSNLHSMNKNHSYHLTTTISSD